MEYDLPSFDAVGGAPVNPVTDPDGASKALAAVSDPGAEPTLKAPPQDHCELPFGVRLPDLMEVAQDAQVRELTGADEEALARVAGNPLRYYDTILNLGTVAVGGEKADRNLLRSLPMADRDTLLLAVRRATFGDQIAIERLACPHCGQLSDVTVHLDEIPMRRPQDPVVRTFEVALREGRAVLRQPDGADQMVFADKDLSVAETNTLLLSRVITALTRDGKTRSGSLALAKELGMSDRRTLLAAISENTYGPQYGEVSMTHEACGGEVPIPLTPGDLFRG
jgi:hypothetical protein